MPSFFDVSLTADTFSVPSVPVMVVMPRALAVLLTDEAEVEPLTPVIVVVTRF